MNASLARAEQLLLGMTETSVALGEMIQVTQRQLEQVLNRTGRTLTHVDEFWANASGATEQLGRSSRELRGLLRATAAPLRTSVYNFRAASESFKELGRTLAQEPSSLLFSDPPAERELP